MHNRILKKSTNLFLWPQVRHLENSQFKISKPLLYSTCTSKGWKETAITHWESSQKHYPRKCIPQETTKVFSWKHSVSPHYNLRDIRHLPTSLFCLSSPMWQLYLPPVPLTGPGWCRTADFNQSLPGKCLFSSVSREPLPLSELSLWSMTRHIPVAVLLNLTHYISSLSLLPSSLFVPYSFAFAWLKVIMCLWRPWVSSPWFHWCWSWEFLIGCLC